MRGVEIHLHNREKWRKGRPTIWKPCPNKQDPELQGSCINCVPLKQAKAPWIISPGCFCFQEGTGISGRLSTTSTDHDLLVRLALHCSYRSFARNCSTGRLCSLRCIQKGRKRIHERKISMVPKYIGWRTLPYLPLLDVVSLLDIVSRTKQLDIFSCNKLTL